MKKIIVLGIAVMMVMSLAAVANAAMDTTWAVQLRAVNSAGATAGNITLGTTATATDNFTTTGAQDAYLATLVGTPAEISSTIAPRAAKDMRAPVLDNSTKTWDLILFNNGGAATTVTLTGWVAAGTNGIIAGPDGKVELKMGNEVLWTAAHDVAGAQTNVGFTRQIVLAANQVVNLQLVASTVPDVVVTPEPGSIVALFSGLVGLVGFGIRRRK